MGLESMKVGLSMYVDVCWSNWIVYVNQIAFMLR